MLNADASGQDRKWHYKIEDAGDPSSWATWMQANRGAHEASPFCWLTC